MAAAQRVYILIGSNIEPERNIRAALLRLQNFIELVAVSPVYETPAIGSQGPNFLNLVVQVSTELDTDALKYEVLRPVESALGRVRGTDKNAPRTMDLDILIQGKKILEPAIWLQAHISIPLADLLPDLANPTTGQTLRELADQFRQSVPVRKRTDFQPARGLLGQLEL